MIEVSTIACPKCGHQRLKRCQLTLASSFMTARDVVRDLSPHLATSLIHKAQLRCKVLEKAKVSTIGFTKTSAEGFFERLLNSGVKKVVDVRLHNTSQLAAFAKADDLAYFLKKIGKIEYVHQPLLAPTDPMLKAYKKEKGDWRAYEKRFLGLMAERNIEKRFRPGMFDGVCFLCSEDKPHYCHRRLVCEYLNDKWDDALDVHHL